MPANIFTQVDFPDPFGPIRPMRFPDCILTVKSRNKRREPYDLETDWQLSKTVMYEFYRRWAFESQGFYKAIFFLRGFGVRFLVGVSIGTRTYLKLGFTNLIL